MKRVDPVEDRTGHVTYRVEVDEPCGERIDRYLAERLSLSRSQIAALIDAGLVRVADRVPKKSYLPETGDLIVVQVPPPEPTEAVAQDIPIEIVFEDEGFLVVNKPAGMVAHPAPGHPHGTVINALLHHVGKLSTVGGARRPGIVHRLDKDTSGLMIVAKDETVHRRLAEALARREITRRYLAACWGHLPDDTLRVEADVGRHRADRKRMAVVPGSRPAVTEIERLERWTSADYLKVRLLTGRTHQIRVHLRHIGHPVIGDQQYGPGWERGFEGRWPRELAKRLNRQFLHAAELAFKHPVSGRLLEFSTSLPEDLAAVAEWARRTS
ncbi:MAG: RluA family pseudouridine synthase [Gemmatimonadota bacterium]|nr:MAG: RluA family pseudouridine synthase [Gemmatimonadota bacterium]